MPLGCVTWRFVAALCLAVLASSLGRAADATGALRPFPLRVGITKFAFSNVNRNDAEAAFKIFSQAVARRKGYEVDSFVQVFDDIATFKEAVQSNTLSMIIIDSWRYLAMLPLTGMKPCFVSSERDTPGKRYLVLAQKDGPIQGMDDLRGKDVSEIDVNNTKLACWWLETSLRTRGLGTPETFFGRLEKAGRASSAILPVYFGRKSACVVDEIGFEMVKEMNPQVGSRMKIVQASEPLVDGLICLSDTVWPTPQHRQDVADALQDLHIDPAGKQILTLFHTSRLVPFEARHLEATERLKADYERFDPAKKDTR
ncbi:MAG: PhnD/SsuA/transferrin family substrate-binding protein [Verrucomicrobiales bacterium]|nr:PhnD/SsuA/transferrin family substrate-binding protein [Verrucomicrobiales bacterium]